MDNIIKKIKLRIAIIFSIILLIGCFQKPNNDSFIPTSNEIQTSTEHSGYPISAAVTSTNTPILEASADPTNEITEDLSVQNPVRDKYEFEIDIDYQSHRLDVKQSISFKNKTGNELTEIPVIIPPNHYENTFSMNNFSTDPGSRFDFPDKGKQAGKIVMNEPLNDGATIFIKMEYSINLPALSGPFGYTERQMNLMNWYPFIPTCIKNQGWIVNEFSSIGEYIAAEKMEFSANVTISDANLLVAANAGEGTIDGNTITYSLLDARDFSFSISPHFLKITQNYGDLTINAYVFPEDAEAGQELIHNTASALLYYQSLFDSKYPRSTLNIVEADFPDGMESDGMYFLSKDYISKYDGTHRNYMTILSAHETAHQWFYGSVGNDPAQEPWLDEAMCTLSEIMFFEEFYPADVEWWWKYRVDSYSPAGKVDTSVYEETSLRKYINAVYLQGVRFLSDLRVETGNEGFIIALRNYVKENQDQIASAQNFFSQFENYDISELKTRYFSK